MARILSPSILKFLILLGAMQSLAQAREAPIAIVYGGSRGIGAGFVREYQRQGYDVIIVSRNPPAPDERFRPGWEHVSADLSDADGARTALSRIGAEKWARVEAVVYSAGTHVPDYGPGARMASMMRIKTESAPAMIGQALKQARRLDQIILVSSISGLTPFPGHRAYSESNRFLIEFGEKLGRAVPPGMSVTVTAPGLTASDMLDEFGDSAAVRTIQMPVEDVVRETMATVNRGGGLIVPGLRNRLAVRSFQLAESIWGSGYVNAYKDWIVNGLHGSRERPGVCFPVLEALSRIIPRR
jgi:short-subunit dehydrogenase